jgi:hypothetical protein
MGRNLGVIDREPATGTCHWLRFYDANGNLVPLPEEFEQARADAEQARADAEQARADAEQARAEQAEQENARLLERLRARGIDVNEL